MTRSRSKPWKNSRIQRRQIFEIHQTVHQTSSSSDCHKLQLRLKHLDAMLYKINCATLPWQFVCNALFDHRSIDHEQTWANSLENITVTNDLIENKNKHDRIWQHSASKAAECGVTTPLVPSSQRDSALHRCLRASVDHSFSSSGNPSAWRMLGGNKGFGCNYQNGIECSMSMVKASKSRVSRIDIVLTIPFSYVSKVGFTVSENSILQFQAFILIFLMAIAVLGYWYATFSDTSRPSTRLYLSIADDARQNPWHFACLLRPSLEHQASSRWVVTEYPHINVLGTW